MGFVDEYDGIARQVIEQARRRFTRRAFREVARIVFDAGTVAGFDDHFDVVLGTLFEALRFDQSVVLAQDFEAFFEFGFDVVDGCEQHFAWGDVVRFGVNREAWHAA